MSASVGGATLILDDNGNLTIQGDLGRVQIHASSLAQFASVIQTMANSVPDSILQASAASSSYVPHFKSQNELAAEMSLASKQNEERRAYSVRMQEQTGMWGSKRGD